MDCYLSKRKCRCRSKMFLNLGVQVKYQLVKISFVFKNYKVDKKGEDKQQIIIIDVDLLFPESKLVVITSKSRLLRLIKDKLYKITIRYLTFSQFDVNYKSSSNIKNVINLKNLKIKLKEEDLENIFIDYTKYILTISNKLKQLKFENQFKYKDRDIFFLQDLEFSKKTVIYQSVHPYPYIPDYEIADLKTL